ncbi:MAG: rRNA pseudouridine synthase [Aquificae bacterium]|nr:rRNA pseudouridine synthase [Aquificota bacterium]
MKKIRLDKFLSHLGFGTRKEVKNLLKEGVVTVNDVVTKKPISIDIEKDTVKVEDKPIKYKEHFYYMLNKPQGYITATKSEEHSTVMDLMSDEPVADKLFPVGRLDIDTEGLLIITNDGQLSHRLTHPKWNVEKEYYAVVKGNLSDKDFSKYEKEGLKIDKNEKTKPFKIKVLSSQGDKSHINITVTEGKYHIVKRIMEKLGYPVLYLKRIRIGSLVLDKELKSGEYRELTEKEVKQLKKTVKMED